MIPWTPLRVADAAMLAKSVGFSRGLGSGYHKYWKRERVMRGGKLSWRYYYDNPKDRKAWIERKAKELKGKHKEIAKLQEQHKGKGDFAKDHPDMKAARRALEELTAEYLAEVITWDKPPKLKFTDEVMAQYHKAVITLYGNNEPDDPHGKAISAFRALELSYKALPPNIKEFFSGAIKEMVIEQQKDKDFQGRQAGAAGWCRGGPNGSKIAIAYDLCQKVSIGRGAKMKGGLFTTECIIHEMGHAIHNMIGAHNRGGSRWAVGGGEAKEWKGPVWDDWMAFYDLTGKAEKGVTDYAQKNEFERWAESFTATIMYPRQMASTAPQTYQWFRHFLGEDAVRPIHTDDAAVAKLEKQRAAAIKAHDSLLAKELVRKIDAQTGVLDMAENDRRLKWWLPDEKKIARLIREADRPNYTAAYKSKDDKFFEMSHNGRTLFMRVGPSGPNAKYSGWDPNDPAAARIRPRKSEIKEIYDEHGESLSRDVAWWHLHQDELDDDHPDVDRLPGLDITAKDDPEAFKIIRRNKMFVRLVQTSKAAHNPKDKKHLDAKRKNPVEITANDFRLRSGTFVYNAWDAAGHEELAALSTEKDPAKREALITALQKKQPYMVSKQPRDAKGRFTKRRPVLRAPSSGGEPVPAFHAIRYMNDNPDGTKTVIDVVQDTQGDITERGRYFIDSPVWRELLTPNGEDIKSAADLAAKCSRAAADKRTAWVSIKADTSGGDSAHFLHLQVQFDGKGQPRILGDEWKRRLGKDKPRIDDLLSPGKGGGTGKETTRPTIQAERIKLEKRAKRKVGKERVPKLGGRVVIRVTGEEISRKKGKEVVARLAGVLPGKKAGEVPSPPGWDRMPEGSAPLPRAAKVDKAQKLTAREKRLKKQKLLPDWYKATKQQRAWLKATYSPAEKEWKRTKKALTAESWPERYMFIGEVSGGAPGKKFFRHGQGDLLRDIREPVTSRQPRPLKHDTLVYAFKKIDPITGKVIEQQPRIVLPSDGSVTLDSLEGLHGVVIEKAKQGQPAYAVVNMDGFAKLREHLGGVSLTAAAEDMVRAKADLLREAARKAMRKEHVVNIEDIDPGRLHDKGVGVVSHLPDGAPFTLAVHQQEVIQLAMDNGGRALAAHYMGTGKTVSAVVLSKMLMAQRDPEDESKPHPNAPKKTLVVVPLNTVEQWRQAYQKFDEGCTVVGAGKNDIPAANYLKMVQGGTNNDDVVVVGPEYWVIHQAELRKAGFDALIIDEAHQGLKNEKAERNKVMNAWNPNMKSVFLLTGTPITTSPADILEYVKILSNGEQWAGMTRAQFIEEYLEESIVPGELGQKGKKGPKVQIKAEKREELAAIIAQWTHVAAPKDVRGKTLPAVRMEESKHAEMIGIQSSLYGLYMAALGDADMARLGGGVVSEDETAGMGDDAKRAVVAAKAIANCVAFKPQNNERFIMTVRDKPTAGGKVTREKIPWTTFDPARLKSKTLRKKLAGRWPTTGELGAYETELYSLYFASEFGVQRYQDLAGRKITKEQFAIMKRLGWPDKLPNPEAGPVGIRCRGYDTPAPPHPDLELAMEFQRVMAQKATTKVPKFNKQGEEIGSRLPTEDEALYMAGTAMGISETEGYRLLAIRPDATEHHDSVSSAMAGWGYKGVSVDAGDHWVSDTRGSLHLLYRPEDWDEESNRPRSAGGFSKVNPLDIVAVSGKGLRGALIAGAGGAITKEKAKGLAKNKDLQLAYTGQETDTHAQVQDISSGALYWVKKTDVSALVKSLMDPGMRAERRKADMAMSLGNAKSEELRAYISKFHQDLDAGPDGDRQMVMFANGILDGCRTMEATLRCMGYKDVNETLEGSPHYDPEDPGPAPNGKYFVTYIGSTYTGNRDLNIAIFQKVKDKLNRDTEESLFVQKTREGRKWASYPGDTEDYGIQMSQWMPEQRETIKAQLGITPPESFDIDENGVTQYFYGTKRSAAILREITLTGNPVKMADPNRADAARKKIAALKAEYAAIVKKTDKSGKRVNTTDKPPMTQQQITVFNNCDMIICSDAAQVGMNLGNAAEMVMYDSLSSPMAEWQRMTRSARMLPPAVRKGLEPIVAKIKAQENAIFQPAHRGQPEGWVRGFSVGPGAPSDHTFSEALASIQNLAYAKADDRGLNAGEKAKWVSIRNKARVAANLGSNQAIAALYELADTPWPGGTSNVISFNSHDAPNPMEGTYDEMHVNGQAQAVQAVIDGLDEKEQKALKAAGFVVGKNEDGTDAGGTLDPTSLYLAIRAQEILEYIDAQRASKAETMRQAPGGEVVTDSDVMNSIIDDLSPEDRAILKTKKYLVNVRRLGVSAHVPQMATVSKHNDAPPPEFIKGKAFTGYEKEHPIAPEAATRAVGRARMTSNEILMKTIQDGAKPRTEMDYQTTIAADIAGMSRMDLEKAVDDSGPILVFEVPRG